MRTSRQILAACLALALASNASGQAPAPPPPETQAQTIAKCLEDMGAKDADVRRRAILVLGKYSDARARAALVKALADPEPTLRLSALVALTEGRLGRGVSVEAAEPALRLLGDPDVHVRRMASSMVASAFGSFLMSRRTPRGAPPTLPPDLRQVVAKAFTDEDAVIRKNMANVLSMLHAYAPEEVLVALLGDTEREVRMLAMDAAVRRLPLPRFVAVAAPLARDADALIRRRLARLLALRPGAATYELLELLARDQAPEVTALAILGLVRAGRPSWYAKLRPQLDHPRLDANLARELIEALPMNRQKGEKALLELLRHERWQYRLVALEAYARHYRKKVTPDLLLGVLGDGRRELRQAGGNLLRMLPPLTAEQLAGLIDSRYPDVRLMAIGLAYRLPNEKARDLLMDLLLDDDSQVHRRVVYELVRRKVAGWRKVLAQSLEDDDHELAGQAADALLRSRTPEAKEILLQYVKTSTNVERKRAISEKMTLLGLLPPAQAAE